MIEKFARKFFLNLKEYEFYPIYDTTIEIDFEEMTSFYPYAIQNGASIYIINLMDSEKISVEKFVEMQNIFNTRILDNPFYYQFKNIFIVNLIVSNSAEVNNFYMDLAEGFENQHLYNIYWTLSFNDSTYTLGYNKEQPDKILNLRKIIDDSFNNSIGDSYSIIESDLISDKSYFPYLTYFIIIINAILLALMELNGSSTNISTLISFGALDATGVLINGEYHRMFTCMFLHIGIQHWMFNSLSLYIYGSRIESKIGALKFFIIYIFSGLAGSAASLITLTGVAAGASGAIFGLSGAALAYTLLTRKSLDGLNNYIIALLIISGVFYGFLSDNVDNMAHLGGLFAGFIICYIFTFIELRKEGDTR